MKDLGGKLAGVDRLLDDMVPRLPLPGRAERILEIVE
jgi:hypothetical protein